MDFYWQGGQIGSLRVRLAAIQAEIEELASQDTRENSPSGMLLQTIYSLEHAQSSLGMAHSYCVYNDKLRSCPPPDELIGQPQPPYPGVERRREPKSSASGKKI